MHFGTNFTTLQNLNKLLLKYNNVNRGILHATIIGIQSIRRSQ